MGLIDPHFPELLDRLPQDRRRAAVLEAVRLAGVQSELVDPAFVRGLARASEGRCASCPELDDVNALVERLDEVAWAAQEKGERGEATLADYDKAFRMARAASALAAALEDDDTRQGAAASIYEASHAINDLVQLRAILESGASTVS